MKYFVVSDIHSYYTNLAKALTEAGFSTDNKDHKLVICGDIFDRGLETVELYHYILELLAKDKVILIKGNHEDLLLRALKEERVEEVDFLNHTADTIIALANALDPRPLGSYQLSDLKYPNLVTRRIFSILKESNLTNFIQDNFVDFYVIKSYVLVHGFLPLTTKLIDNKETVIINPDWSNASQEEWQEARWLNGQKLVLYQHLKLEGKTIICGHYPSAYGHLIVEKGLVEEEPKISTYQELNYTPFITKDIVALDGMVWQSGQINVFIIED